MCRSQTPFTLASILFFFFFTVANILKGGGQLLECQNKIRGGEEQWWWKGLLYVQFTHKGVAHRQRFGKHGSKFLDPSIHVFLFPTLSSQYLIICYYCLHGKLAEGFKKEKGTSSKFSLNCFLLTNRESQKKEVRKKQMEAGAKTGVGNMDTGMEMFSFPHSY